MSEFLSYIRIYITYLFGRDHVNDKLLVMNISPPLLNYIYWSLIFSILCIVSPFVYKRTFPITCSLMDKRKLTELPCYCASIIHHLYVTPLGFYCIFNDFNLFANGGTVQLNQEAIDSISFIFGYLIGDTIFLAIPEFLTDGKYEYLIHHICSFALFFGLLISPSEISRYIPHLLICEITNIFLIIAWHLKVHGLRETVYLKITELLFVITFFLTRIVNLPLSMGALIYNFGNQLSFIKYFLIPIIGLQFYWFSKIISALYLRTNSSKLKSKE